MVTVKPEPTDTAETQEFPEPNWSLVGELRLNLSVPRESTISPMISASACASYPATTLAGSSSIPPKEN